LDDKELNIPMHFIFPSICDDKLAPKNKESMALTVFVPFKNEQYWKEKKAEFVKKLINRASDILPDIRREIIVKETVTPFDLYKYTYNRSGSVHGWAAMPSQIDRLIMPEKSCIDGLFLAGQWVTHSSGEAGLPMAAYIGYSTARLILAEKKDK
jgi:phytoene dehydrogenase-like protein